MMYNKLTTLAEYIDDTEDFVNIKQDSQRNKLLVGADAAQGAAEGAVGAGSRLVVLCDHSMP